VAGIGLALFHRERTGDGQHVDIAMVDALFHAHEMGVQGPSITKGRWKAKRMGSRSTMYAPQGIFKSAEGYIALHVMQAQWAGLCRAMGRAELIDDERFASIIDRHDNSVELNDLVEGWLCSLPSDADALARLDAERVPCAPVLSPDEAIGHPYFEARGMVRLIDDPVMGSFHVPGNPIRLSAQPDDPDLVAPLLGEHNAAVLRELGYTDEHIAALEGRGVLRSKPI